MFLMNFLTRSYNLKIQSQLKYQLKYQIHFLSYVDSIFSCLQMHSEKFFKIHFHEHKYFFKSLFPRYTGHLYVKIIAYEQCNFQKNLMFLGGHGFIILTRKNIF